MCMILSTQFSVVKCYSCIKLIWYYFNDSELDLKQKKFLILIFLLFGCHRKHKKINQVPSKIKNTKLYVMRIAGVECKQCVLAALQALKAVKQVKHVDCLFPRKQYDQSRFECFIEKLKNEPLSIDQVQKNLAREDFELQSIDGEFSGTIVSEEGKLKFIPESSQKKLSICANEQVLLDLEEKKDTKPITLSGKLDFIDQQFYI